MNSSVRKSGATDLLHGSIWKSILFFSLPLLAGNLFQQLYNTVDSYVVGNYVSSNALAAVGQSTPIINMLVGFFMGLSTGAGVVISQYFGAKKIEKMRQAIHTSIALTLILCVVFTILGMLLTTPILRAIGSPEEVLPLASLYLKVYFAGVSFLLIYNMGSGILRAIGDSKRPLQYLIVSSISNIILDFVFVLHMGLGVEGVAIATMISQGLSAALVALQLIRTQEDYRVTVKEIKITGDLLKRIISFGIPAALQNSIVSFSNVIVQSYISSFGAAAVAGYGATVKLDGFLQLPIQSFSMAVTTFVGQNYGARAFDRVKKGIRITVLMCCIVVGAGSLIMYFNGAFLISVFSKENAVILAGNAMIRVFAPGYILLPFCHVLAGALRGVGLSKVPMYFMIFCFVVLRQIYLIIFTPISQTLTTVYLAWPLTWIVCTICLLVYYRRSNWLK